MRERLRRWLGWLIGAAVIAIIFYHLRRSPEWRGFEWGRLVSLLVHAKVRLLVFAVFATCSSYFVRAWRWKLFVNPVKKCSFRILVAAQFLGFSSIYLVGRAGEVVRPAYIANRERLPFVSQVAVWVVERVYDSIALAVLLALALYFRPIPGATRGAILAVHKMHAATLTILILAAAAIVILVLFKAHAAQLIRALSSHLRFGRGKIGNWLLEFLASFSAGLAVMNNPLAFSASIASTVLLWALTVTTIWLDFLSLGGHVAALSWWSAGLVQFLASVGLLVQLPGIGGGYQVAVLLALEELFHVSAELAAGAAILTYATLTIPCIALALVFLIHEGLTFKKLKLMVKSRSEAGVCLPAADGKLAESSSIGAGLKS